MYVHTCKHTLLVPYSSAHYFFTRSPIKQGYVCDTQAIIALYTYGRRIVAHTIAYSLFCCCAPSPPSHPPSSFARAPVRAKSALVFLYICTLFPTLLNRISFGVVLTLKRAIVESSEDVRSVQVEFGRI